MGGGELTVTLYPDYEEYDAQTDLAVIRTNDRWRHTSRADYAHIYSDSLDHYGRLQLYGYGVSTFGGEGDGTLRTGTMELDWYGMHHFNMIARATRSCEGDSGGPFTVYASTSGDEVQVAGLLSSNSENTPGNYCIVDEGIARASRLSGKVDWIESVLGRSCPEVTSATTQRKLRDCRFPEGCAMPGGGNLCGMINEQTGCWCDDQCTTHGDCCPDKATTCGASPDSCFGRCGQSAPANCWCDVACSSYGDCCPDMIGQCG